MARPIPPDRLPQLVRCATEVFIKHGYQRTQMADIAAAANHSHAFVYFCENEARFVQDLPAGVLSARQIFIAFITAGQARGDVRIASPTLLADMVSGALCAVALTWLHAGRRKKLEAQVAEVEEGCWRMIAASLDQEALESSPSPH